MKLGQKSSEDTAAADRRFLLLRKKLDSLNYTLPLQIESSALAERLLNDLLKTTEGFQNMKKLQAETSKKCVEALDALDPLKRENVKLVAQNNDLHLSMIKIKEDAEFSNQKWKTTFHSIDQEKADLKFTAEQKESALRKVREERDEELMNWAEQVRTQDQRIEELTREIRGYQENKGLLSEKVNHLQVQLANREQEISRLASKVEVGSVNLEKLSQEYLLNQQVDKVERLNHQIDFLSKENSQMESELAQFKADSKRIQMIKEESQHYADKVAQLTRKIEEGQRSLQAKDQSKRELEDMVSRVTETLQETIKGAEREKKEFISELERIQLLLEPLKQENASLREEAKKADQVVYAYQSDKRAFTQSVEQSRNERESVLEKLQGYVKQLEEQQEKLRRVEDEKTVLTGRISSLQREIELTNVNERRMVSENASLNEEIVKLHATIRGCEGENLALNEERNELLTEADRLRHKKAALEDQIDKLKSASYKIKSDVDTQGVAKDRVEKQLELLQKESALQKKDIANLESMLATQKAHTADAEEQSRSQYAQIRALSDHVKELERQNKITTDLLETKAKEIREVEVTRAELERENATLLALKRNFDEISSKNNRLQQSISDAEEKRLRSVHESDSVKFVLADKEEEVKRLQEQLQLEREEKSRMADELRTMCSEQEAFNDSVQKSKSIESEFSHIGYELEKTRERERKAVLEALNLQANIRKLEAADVQSARLIESLTNSKEDHLKEIKELRKQVLSIRNEKEDIVTQTIELSEKLVKLQIEIDDSKDLIAKEERRSRNLEKELSLSVAEKAELKNRVYELESSVKQLKTLSDGQERTRAELLERLQSRTAERIADEKSQRELEKQVEDLSLTLREIEADLKRKDASLAQVDRERDAVQDQLDAQTQVNVNLAHELEEAQTDLARLKEKRSESCSKIEMSAERIAELEHSCKEANKRIATLKTEVENCVYTVSVKEKELSEAKSLKSIAEKSSHNLTEELLKVATDRDTFKAQVCGFNTLNVNESTSEIRRLKADIRSKELENEEVLENYRSMCLASERLERQLKDIGIENQNLFKKQVDLEKEIAGLQGEVSHARGSKADMLVDLQGLERQITFLNQKLEAADEHIHSIEGERRELHKSLAVADDVRGSAEKSKEDLVREIALRSKENTHLVETCNQFSREREARAVQMEALRLRNSELENIIVQERQGQHRQVLELTGLQQERDYYLKELEQYKGVPKFSATQSNTDRDSGFAQSFDKNTVERRLEEKELTIKRLEGEVKSLQRQQQADRQSGNDLVRMKPIEAAVPARTASSLAQGGDVKKPLSGWEKMKAEGEEYRKSLEQASKKTAALNSSLNKISKDYSSQQPSRPSYY